MNKCTLIEIGVASALGAVIGLSIAIALDLPRWLWIPCGLVAFFCYRPWEIFVITGEVCGEVWETTWSAIASSRHLPHFVSTINWSEVRRVGTITFQVLCCFVVAWVGLMYPSLLVYFIAPFARPDATIGYLMLIPIVSFIGSNLLEWDSRFSTSLLAAITEHVGYFHSVRGCQIFSPSRILLERRKNRRNRLNRVP